MTTENPAAGTSAGADKKIQLERVKEEINKAKKAIGELSKTVANIEEARRRVEHIRGVLDQIYNIMDSAYIFDVHVRHHSDRFEVVLPYMPPYYASTLTTGTLRDELKAHIIENFGLFVTNVVNELKAALRDVVEALDKVVERQKNLREEINSIEQTISSCYDY